MVANIYLGILLDIIFLGGGIAVAMITAEHFIERLFCATHKLKWNNTAIAIVIAIAGSIPGLAAAIISVMKGLPEVGIATLIGEGFINICVVIGICTILAGKIVIEKTNIYKDGVILLMIIGSTATFLFSSRFAHDVSAIRIIISLNILLVFMLYIFMLMERDDVLNIRLPTGLRAKSCQIAGDLDHQFMELLKKEKKKSSGALTDFGVALFFITICIIACNFLVEGALGLGKVMQIPAIILGLTVIPLGTLLPELLAAIGAVKRGESNLSVGSALASNSITLTAGFGMMGLFIKSLDVDNIVVFFDLPALFLVSVLGMFFMAKGKLKRWQGIVLLAVYVAFVIVRFMLGGPAGH